MYNNRNFDEMRRYDSSHQFRFTLMFIKWLLMRFSTFICYIYNDNIGSMFLIMRKITSVRELHTNTQWSKGLHYVIFSYGELFFMVNKTNYFSSVEECLRVVHYKRHTLINIWVPWPFHLLLIWHKYDDLKGGSYSLPLTWY